MDKTPPTRSGKTTRRRTASVRRSRGEWPSHLDLDNLIVALLSGPRTQWPNPLYELGYRVHAYDAELELLEPAENGSLRGAGTFAPDVIAFSQDEKRLLVLECKTGSALTVDQLPEGRRAGPDAWVRATAVGEVGSGITASGVIVAEDSLVASWTTNLASQDVSALRVTAGRLALDPDSQSDRRIAPALAAIPESPTWPTTLIPFDRHAEGDWKPRVLRVVTPYVLSMAEQGERLVAADAVVAKTHAAVWGVTSAKTKKAWAGRVGDVFKDLAQGALKDMAVYDARLQRLVLQQVRAGERPPLFVIGALRQGLTREYQRTQSKSRRVTTKRGPLPARQIRMWEEDVFD
jgi:hypothetical protein